MRLARAEPPAAAGGCDLVLFGDTQPMSEADQIPRRGAFSRARKAENRIRLTEAAKDVFERLGYPATSIDDIAQAAGVSRQTFYRHFEGKFSVAMALYEEQRVRAKPLWQHLGPAQARDMLAVVAWLELLFDHHRQELGSIRTFMEMSVMEPGFIERAKLLVPDTILWLGERIPAFAGYAKAPDENSPYRIEAWMLVFQLIDHASSVAMDFMPFERKSLIEVLAAKFIAFVTLYGDAAPRRRK